MTRIVPWILAALGVTLALVVGSRTASRVEAEQIAAGTGEVSAVTALMEEARQLVATTGEVDAALAKIDEAIALKPDMLLLKHRKADLLLSARRDQLALDLLEGVVAKDPDNWDSYTRMMTAWGRLDMCDEAVARVEAFMARHPDHAQAHYARGFCHYKEGRWDQALSDVQRACDLGHQPGCDMAAARFEKPGVREMRRVRLPPGAQ